MRPPRFDYYTWWCDDDCDCTEPRVTHIKNHPLHPRFVLSTTVWRGTYLTEADDDESAMQDREQSFACLMGIVTNHGWLR